jgi:hypothetical protein
MLARGHTMSVRLVKLSLLLFGVSIAGLLTCGISLGAPQDIVGTWNIAAELVVQPSEDPYAPRPGTIQQDTWMITESANELILSSSKGSCSGQYSNNGATFEFTVPIITLQSSYTYCLTHIECFVDSHASMYGTIENHYRTYNYITGATIETGLEAWKFRAVK